MGTNFYIRGHKNDYSQDYHIGKRSAAGPYCWDCKQTLCKSGETGIHYDKSGWYATCPKCGKKYDNEAIESSSVGRELGFNKSDPAPKSGVSSCSSFSWAMSEHYFDEWKSNPPQKCSHCNASYSDLTKWIENEYGDLFTLIEFEAILSECPIHYFHSVGEEFS